MPFDMPRRRDRREDRPDFEVVLANVLAEVERLTGCTLSLAHRAKIAAHARVVFDRLAGDGAP